MGRVIPYSDEIIEEMAVYIRSGVVSTVIGFTSSVREIAGFISGRNVFEEGKCVL